MLHFPFTHPQLPAPQSIDPSQLIVQSLFSQDNAAAAARFIQLAG
jgi:hypothetical protein